MPPASRFAPFPSRRGSAAKRLARAAARTCALACACYAATGRAGDAPLIDWLPAQGSWLAGQNWLGGEVPRAASGQGARVANGGTATVFQKVPAIECLNLAKGTVVVGQGATLQVVQRIDVLPEGTLALADGAAAAAATNLLGTLNGRGTLDGALTNGGVVSPGNANQPLGQILVNGNYRQTGGGRLQMEVAGVSLGSFDRVVVQGKAELGGKLTVNLAPNLQLPPGQPLALLLADEFFGDFETVTFSSTSTAKAFVWTCAGATFSIACFSLGDMNLDGAVDATDSPLFALALVDKIAYAAEVCALTGYEVEAALIGNVNQLGSFDFDDISAFASLAGLSTAAVVADIQALGRPIPEPGALLLACCGAAAAIAPGRGRRPLRAGQP